ncbi:competence protein ComER [Melghiribacillus thermohalophilus]|uniref:Competence protein ComER n=1 Tax=Melghiribacillus thermohalophilus TaxID=1324956 RepID=A0A4R3NBP7_9BACI|nr:late competence protein ComER [Melghiribacillus thermohalophilus]TCT27047.1 competence protein ComER [Melghiribacillus thermohalophilus]
MNWGIIGTGNMGKVLIHALIEGGVTEPRQLFIHNRTLSKAFDVKQDYPDINVCPTPEKTVKFSDIIFICVKPLDVFPLIKRIQPELNQEHCVISITSPISVQQLEEYLPCQTARIIPSITNRGLFGVTLLSFGEQIDSNLKEYLIQSCKLFSSPIIIDDEITRVSSDIISCGPAFFSYLIQRMIQAACEETDIEYDNAVELAEKMIVGFGKLIEKGYYSFENLEKKVTVKGGVTGAGIEVLEREVGDMFHKLFRATHNKYYDDQKKIMEQLST